jgi:hypothetical protein
MASGMAVRPRSSATRIAVVAAVAAACLLAALTSLGPVEGAPVPAPTVRGARPAVTVLAGVPGERVDAAVDGRSAVRGLRYGHVSDDVPVNPGAHVVSLRFVGGAEDGGSVDLRVRVGAERDVTVARYLDDSGLPQVGAFPVDRSPVPDGGARVVVRHLAALPRADVRRGGRVVVAGLRNGRTATKVVRPGRAAFDVVLAGQTDRLVGPVDLELRPGRVTVLSVVGSARGDDVAVVLQEEAARQPQVPSAPPTTTTTTAGSLLPSTTAAFQGGAAPPRTAVSRVVPSRRRPVTPTTTPAARSSNRGGAGPTTSTARRPAAEAPRVEVHPGPPPHAPERGPRSHRGGPKARVRHQPVHHHAVHGHPQGRRRGRGHGRR